MLAGATGSVHLEPDREMVRPNLPRVEEAPKQRILRACDRMERAGAVEDISESLGPAPGRSSAAVLDFDPRLRFASGHDPRRGDLQLIAGDHPCDNRGNFGGNSVAMDVPPWTGVAKGTPLAVMCKA